MFLITTADQRFWKTDKPILFLGEWCKLFSEEHIWGKLPHEVLPYHWDDRKKLHRDYLYLDRLYEEVLTATSSRLNKIHNVNHSIRYWRIVIGPWLAQFIQILYDRYQSIICAISSGKVTYTLIGKYNREHVIPKGFEEFMDWYSTDAYNQYLYSRIIEHNGRLPFSTIEINEKIDIDDRKKYNDRLSIKKQLIKWYGKIVPSFLNQIVFMISYLAKSDLIKLQLALKQMPYMEPDTLKYPRSKIDWKLRDIFSDLRPCSNDFELLLNLIIKDQIPSLYVEGYSTIRDILPKRYPANPKVIVSSVELYSNEYLKIWAADNVERGTKLVGVQHGGHYGIDLWSWAEDHEKRIFDKFYTWGWDSDKDENVKFLPAIKLNEIKQKCRPQKDGRILMALMVLPRYSYHLYSAPTAASGMLSYFDEQYRFANSLSAGNKKSLLVRLYPKDHQWHQGKRWSQVLPHIEYVEPKEPFLKQLNRSRLYIGTYNSTTYLETFAANFPTILFWNPNYWEVSSSAQPYFDGLRKAGILYDTPEAAAKKVDQIAADPILWWQQDDVQAAKNKFCYRFTRMSDNWIKEWRDELKSVAKTTSKGKESTRA